MTGNFDIFYTSIGRSSPVLDFRRPLSRSTRRKLATQIAQARLQLFRWKAVLFALDVLSLGLLPALYGLQIKFISFESEFFLTAVSGVLAATWTIAWLIQCLPGWLLQRRYLLYSDRELEKAYFNRFPFLHY